MYGDNSNIRMITLFLKYKVKITINYIIKKQSANELLCAAHCKLFLSLFHKRDKNEETFQRKPLRRLALPTLHKSVPEIYNR